MIPSRVHGDDKFESILYERYDTHKIAKLPMHECIVSVSEFRKSPCTFSPTAECPWTCVYNLRRAPFNYHPVMFTRAAIFDTGR